MVGGAELVHVIQLRALGAQLSSIICISCARARICAHSAVYRYLGRVSRFATVLHVRKNCTPVIMSLLRQNLSVIISCTGNDSKEAFSRTYEGMVNQANSPFKWNIIVRCSQNCPQNLVRYAQRLCSEQQAISSRIIESSVSFLGDLPSSVATLSRSSYVLLCSCGVVPKENCFSFLEEKSKKYGVGSSVILTIFGIRIFPHSKIDDVSELKEGVHWKSYNDSHAGRALHVFTEEFCFMSVDTLHKILPHHNTPLAQLDNLWCSFILGHILGLPIWKIEVGESIVDCMGIQHPPQIFPECKNKKELCERFYSHICAHNWPQYICHPFHSIEKLEAVSYTHLTLPTIYSV